jgi:beta-N-acetylhexosaminidase
VDILTFSNNIQGSQDRTIDRVHQIIRKFVEDKTVSKERIDQSFARIMQLKKQLNGADIEYYREELVKANNETQKQKLIAESNEKRAVEMAAKMKAEEQKEQSGKGKKKKKKKSE